MLFLTKADIDKFFASEKNYKEEVFQRKIAKALIELPEKSRLRHYFNIKLKEYHRTLSMQKEYAKLRKSMALNIITNKPKDNAFQKEAMSLDTNIEKQEEKKTQLLEVKLRRFLIVEGAITYGKLSYNREGIKAIDHHDFYKVEGRKYRILSDGKSFFFENEEDETDLLKKAQAGHDNYVNEQNKKKELETIRQLIPAAKETISKGNFDNFHFLRLYRKLYVLIEQEFCLPDYKPNKEKGYHILYGSNGGSWYFLNFHYYYYHKFGESYIKSKIQEERDSEYKKELEYMLDMIPYYEENERNEFLEFLEDYTNSANCIKRMSSYFINWYDEISRYAYDYKNRIFQIDLIKDIALMLSYNMYGDFSAEEEENVKYYLEIYDRVKGAFLKNEKMSLFNEINKINFQKGSPLFDFPKSYSTIIDIEKKLKKESTENIKTYPESGIIEIPWNCVRFFQGYMFVYHPNHISGNGYSALRIDDSRIKRSFGEITELLLLRIPPIIAECGNNRVSRIVKMPDLWESIKMLDQPSLIPDYDLLASNIVTKLKGMTITQVRKIIEKKDSAYITYLCNRHLEHYCAYYCLEIKINSDLVESDEEGFIFVIKESSSAVNVVYENTLPSRASIIFEIRRNSFNKSIKFIHEYFSSRTVNKRELLANHRVDCKEHGIINYHHNYHTTIGEWTRRMKRYM